jgi:hypothetical protein
VVPAPLVPVSACVIAHWEATSLQFARRRHVYPTAPGVRESGRRYGRLFTEATREVPGASVHGHTDRAELGVEGVKHHLRSALASVVPGGLFLLAVASHGDESPDLSGEDEDNDQCIVLDDGLLEDDWFSSLWQSRPDVDVVTFADACHADTVLTYIQAPDRAEWALESDGSIPAGAVGLTGGLRPVVSPTVVHRRLQVPRPAPRRLAFASSQKWERSWASASGARFTTALAEAWDEGPTSYVEWFDRTCALLAPRAPDQHPSLTYVAPDWELYHAPPLRARAAMPG